VFAVAEMEAHFETRLTPLHQILRIVQRSIAFFQNLRVVSENNGAVKRWSILLRKVAVSVERHCYNLIPNGCDEITVVFPFRYHAEAWLSIVYNNREEKCSVLSCYPGRSTMTDVRCTPPILLLERPYNCLSISNSSVKWIE